MSHDHENQQPVELTAVEQSLAAIVPAPPRVDRDRLMFLAGQASTLASGGREPPEAIAASVGVAARNATEGVPYSARLRRGLFWPATSAALAATSLALAWVLATRPAPEARIAYRDREVQVAAAPPTAPFGTPQTTLGTAPIAGIPADNYVRSREVALRLGLDALGGLSSGGSPSDSPPPTYGSLLESFLPAVQDRSQPRTESSQM